MICKSLIACILFTLIYFEVKCQTQTPILGNSYITEVDHLEVYGVSSQNKLDPSNSYFVSRNSKFRVIGFADDKNLKIIFWKFSGPPENLDTSASNFVHTYNPEHRGGLISTWANNKDFIIPIEVFNSSCKLYYGSNSNFTWGALTLPVKLKFGNGDDRVFDVEENLNLGLSAGLGVQLSSRHIQSLNILVLCGTGRVHADSSSFKTYIPTGSNTSVPYPAPSSSVATALSLGLGIVYQYESAFQVGLFIGNDHVVGDLGKYWKYQGKPWIGVAFGVSLFNQSNAQSGAGGSNTPPGH